MSHQSTNPHGFRPRGQEPLTPSGFHSSSSAAANLRPPPPPPPPPPPRAAQLFVQNQVPYNYAGHFNQSMIPSLNQSQTTFPPPVSRKRPLMQPAVEPTTTKTFACGPCSLTFDSKSALDAHESSHVVCTACSFRASPKAVKAHHQAAHGKFAGSGFKTITVAVPGCPVQRFRICVGNRPEDIAAWISDRKRRFPRTSTGGNDASGAGNLSEVSQSPQHKPPTVLTPDPPAQGLSSLLDGYGSSSDEESEEKAEERPAPTSVTPADETGARLGAIPERPNDLNSSTLPKNHHPKRPCRFFARNGNCRNGESCSFSHDAANSRSLSERNDRTGNAIKNRGRPSAPPSLLEKLLASHVRRERLLTIQLLEYIAYDANFFETEARPTE